MPAAVADKGDTDRSEQMWNALKRHILRERERKKQEREQEVEEERLRKEREAREQQDVMTLGETREQIQQLEAKLRKLKEEKHQLFLQLKKVLNEDDNRRRQLVKESNEMLTIQTLSTSGMVQTRIFLPQSLAGPPPIPQNFKFGKRLRSPSPPHSTPASIYHQSYAYKPAAVTNSSYQTSPQKTPQYSGICGYPVPPQELSIYYPQNPLTSREQPRGLYESPRTQAYHIDQKSLEHYALRPPSHLIHMNPAQKTGGITSGYPIRQTTYQTAPAPAPAPASALYTTQSQPLYRPVSMTMKYPNRE
ncbi:G protein pathway suppressor 2 [Agrilus planipennis]|uniref:G protein pathway suppressor 2 n=1 Tax=Agrilus planipennis TaxID=224129 RepID=A0A1W4X6M3_AGRPL|nr:G protein pathway suppressor 2 [Agrilus planipennis]